MSVGPRYPQVIETRIGDMTMNKTTLAFMTCAALAPADLARAGGTDPVLEIVSFRLVEGTDQADFLNAAHGTEAILREQGALTRRFLTVDETGLWTDVVEWTSMNAALTAAETVVTHPDFAPFGSMIDGDTVDMRHAHILWRME